MCKPHVISLELIVTGRRRVFARIRILGPRPQAFLATSFLFLNHLHLCCTS